MTTDIVIRILQDPWSIFLVVLFFGASIFIHELGHYLAGRWRGLHIERFSIGFGPRLIGWKDRQGVDWRISLIPLGGYVSLPQLAGIQGIEGSSESGDRLAPISYADKMIVSVAGAVFNVLFALALGTVLWITGVQVEEERETTVVGQVLETMVNQDGDPREGPAWRAGIRPGDQIVSVDDRNVQSWEDILYAVTTGSRRGEYGNPRTDLSIKRKGKVLDISVFPLLDPHEGIRRLGIAPAGSLIVGETFENSPALLSGLRAGDEITEINGEPVFHRAAFARIIEKDPDAPMTLTVLRDGEHMSVSLQAEHVVYNVAGDTTPMIGIRWMPIYETRHINPVAQIRDAFSLTMRILGALINPRTDVGINNLSGPVAISYTIYLFSQISIIDVIAIVLLININLAILNLLPIPVLDGGHMAIATIGKIIGRPVPQSAIGTAQGFFMLFFIFLFIYITFFDFGRVKRNETAIIAADHAAQQRVPIQFQGNGESATTRETEQSDD